MNTPFFSTSNEINVRSELWGRERRLNEVIRAIKMRMRNSPHHQDCMAFFGPAGVGKSSFIKCLFSPEQKRDFYFKPWLKCDESEVVHDIYQKVDLEKNITSAALDEKLTDAISRALEYVREVDGERYALIREYFKNTEHPSLTSIGKNLQILFEKAHCHITLICDNFQRLTNSPENFDEPYEHLRTLINDRQLSMILITDDDFSRLIPRNGQTSGSMFVHLFKNNRETIIPGLPLEGTTAFINHRLETYYEDDEEAEERISLDTVIRRIHILSGGIPGLICPIADYFFQLHAKEKPIPKKAELIEQLLTDERVLGWFAQWCQSLNENQRAVLSHYAHYENQDWPKKDKDIHSILQNAWGDVANRGLVLKDEETQTYEFVTPLFKEYVLRNMWPPLAETTTRAEDSSPAEATPSPVTTNNITNIYNIDNSQNLTINEHHETIIQQLTKIESKIEVPEFLQLLQDNNPQLLLNRMQEISQQRLSLLGQTPQTPEDDFIVETVVSDIGDNILGEPSKEQSAQMEEIFSSIRPFHPEFDHISHLHHDLSPKCKYYLKAATVVEHQLKGILFDDYSHISFMYGKALEQDLKESFFLLFKEDPQLRNEKVAEGREKTFAQCKSMRYTSIGSYHTVIKNRAPYLAHYCTSKKLQGYDMNIESWNLWWCHLAEITKKAGSIRNQSDHANPNSPFISEKQKEVIKQCLFGIKMEEGGIFQKTQVGKMLYEIRMAKKNNNNGNHG